MNSNPSSEVPENYEAQGYFIERVPTHFTLASVSRLMGFTPQGVRELCQGIGGSWTLIGVTRIGAERVNARLKANGKFEFSVGGNQAYALTESSQQRQEIRRQLADEIVKRVTQQRPQVSKVLKNSKLTDSEVNVEVIDTGSELDVHKIISHYGPRDHTGE